MSQNSPFLDEVQARFGVLPAFFQLAPQNPEIMQSFWGYAKFAYLDNPLPSLFKEKLFVHFSRFCEVRYCIVRHCAFLIGQGRPSGDARCATLSIDEAIKLLRQPFPSDAALEQALQLLAAQVEPLQQWPDENSNIEAAIFACVTIVFLQPGRAHRAADALRHAVGPWFEHLMLFVSFVRTAHFWTQVHPELEIEQDMKALLAIHEVLADRLLHDPEAGRCDISEKVFNELITLRQQIEQIQRTNRAVEEKERQDEFLAMLAHELRNPLAPIRTALEVIRRRNPGPPDRYHEMIERQTNKLVRLVDDLLDVSRITRGKIELRKEPVDVSTLISRAVDSVHGIVNQHRHQLTVALPVEAPFVIGDAVRLDQVIVNLLGNAVKYTPPGGRIWISVECAGGNVEIKVTDTGVGISQDMLERVFDLFQQSGKRLDRTEGGLGLGLTIVRNLVELHEGTVQARSDGPGQGSEFVVRLPLASTETLATDVAGHVAKPAKASTGISLRILVVDDNVDAAETIAALLEDIGHNVRKCHHGRSALALAPEYQPDVILLDIGLPEMDGYEVARQLREASPAMLVALTGYGQECDRQRSAEVGFAHHLIKPVQSATLMTVLDLATSAVS